MRPTIGSRNLPQLVSLMSYECPVCVHPKLIHGSYFNSDKEGEKEFIFTLAKIGEKRCDLSLDKTEYSNLHHIEFLNACAVIGWDADYALWVFDSLKINGVWRMTLTPIEYKNVKKLLDKLTVSSFWKTNNSKRGGGKGFGKTTNQK
jgi:hypothetical protein